MFSETIVIACWIAGTVGFYVAVALACRRLRPHPLMIASYATVRAGIAGGRWWRWYVALFVGTVVGASGLLAAGNMLSAWTPFWEQVQTATACMGVGYAAVAFWPRTKHASPVRSQLSAAARIAVGGGVAAAYLAVLLRWPGWTVHGCGTYALCIPPLVWFRALRIRSAVCFLAALAVFDGIHVFGTHWMTLLIAHIADSPFVLRIPEEFAWHAHAQFLIGHGDILTPGLLVVVAARAAEPREARWLVAGSCAGAALGFAVTTAVTLAIRGPLPALVVLVPCTCMGYGIARLALRLVHKTETLPAAAPQGAE